MLDAEQSFGEGFKFTTTLDGAFEYMCLEFDELLTEAIESEIYFWGRNTFRQNGDYVGSPRDIVDTGELRDSQSMKLK